MPTCNNIGRLKVDPLDTIDSGTVLQRDQAIVDGELQVGAGNARTKYDGVFLHDVELIDRALIVENPIDAVPDFKKVVRRPEWTAIDVVIAAPARDRRAAAKCSQDVVLRTAEHVAVVDDRLATRIGIVEAANQLISGQHDAVRELERANAAAQGAIDSQT